MNKNEDEGRRHVQIGKLKQKFATLIENDLLFDNGKNEEILGEFQIKLVRKMEEIQKDSEKI